MLLGIADANYSFIYVDIGCQGRISDGGVWKNCTFSTELANGTLNLPPESPLLERTKTIPHVFVADDAFPLQNNIMKPYPGEQEKGSKKRIFNYRLCRARRIIENTFGILSAIFRVLRKPLLLKPESAIIITLSCVYLHNFLRKTQTENTSELDGEVIEDTCRAENNQLTSLLPLPINQTTARSANDIRDEFSEYFSSDKGSVPWQNLYA